MLKAKQLPRTDRVCLQFRLHTGCRKDRRCSIVKNLRLPKHALDWLNLQAYHDKWNSRTGWLPTCSAVCMQADMVHCIDVFAVATWKRPPCCAWSCSHCRLNWVFEVDRFFLTTKSGTLLSCRRFLSVARVDAICKANRKVFRFHRDFSWETACKSLSRPTGII